MLVEAIFIYGIAAKLDGSMEPVILVVHMFPKLCRVAESKFLSVTAKKCKFCEHRSVRKLTCWSSVRNDSCSFTSGGRFQNYEEQRYAAESVQESAIAR